MSFEEPSKSAEEMTSAFHKVIYDSIFRKVMFLFVSDVFPPPLCPSYYDCLDRSLY